MAKSGIMGEMSSRSRTNGEYAPALKGMPMRSYRCFALKALMTVAVTLCVLVTLPACSREPSYEDRETFPKETYVPVGDGGLILYDALTVEGLSDPKLTDWVNACASPDRNDHLGGYVLRHKMSEGDKTVFTFLVYYPHGGSAKAVTPELLEGASGYVLNLTFTEGKGTEGYSLCHLTVTVPTDNAPRVRIIDGDTMPGLLVSVSEEPIPAPSAAE